MPLLVDPELLKNVEDISPILPVLLRWFQISRLAPDGPGDSKTDTTFVTLCIANAYKLGSHTAGMSTDLHVPLLSIQQVPEAKKRKGLSVISGQRLVGSVNGITQGDRTTSETPSTWV